MARFNVSKAEVVFNAISTYEIFSSDTQNQPPTPVTGMVTVENLGGVLVVITRDSVIEDSVSPGQSKTILITEPCTSISLVSQPFPATFDSSVGARIRYSLSIDTV